MVALGGPDERPVVIGLRVRAVDLDGPVVVVQRLVVAVLRAVDVAAPDIGGGVVGIRRDGAVVVGEGKVRPAGLAVDERAVGQCLDIVRVELDGAREVGHGLLAPAGAGEHRAAHVVGLRIVRVALDDVAERGEVGCGPEIARFHVIAARRCSDHPGSAGRRAAGQRQGADRERGASQEPGGVGGEKRQSPVLVIAPDPVRSWTVTQHPGPWTTGNSAARDDRSSRACQKYGENRKKCLNQRAGAAARGFTGFAGIRPSR
jgi:hypothetical protein